MSIARPDVQPDAGIWSKPGVWEPEALPASFDFKKYQADRIIAEVNNGGFDQFFRNSSHE